MEFEIAELNKPKLNDIQKKLFAMSIVSSAKDFFAKSENQLKFSKWLEERGQSEKRNKKNSPGSCTNGR